MIVSVVVKVENSVEFTLNRDMNIFSILDALTQGLSGILFHLYVVELSEIAVLLEIDCKS